MKFQDVNLIGSINITGSFQIPYGFGTGSYPQNPQSGSLFLDTSNDLVYVANDNGWEVVGGQVASTPYGIEYLVVAGGGGTGYGNNVIGAGAGGMLFGSSAFSPSTQYTIIVGAGGTGSGAATIGDGTNGQNSSITELSIVAIGGGRSNGDTDLDGGDGGSGGGAGKGVSSIGVPGSGTIGQGNDGAGNDGDAVGGSGGGAGGPGSSSGAYGSTPGGLGLSNSITGTGVTYASGGGSYDRIGVANTGDGAGNGASAGGAGGFPGGSGVVILRMPTANYSGTTTGSPTVTTDGTDTILKFTQSGTYTA